MGAGVTSNNSLVDQWLVQLYHGDWRQAIFDATYINIVITILLFKSVIMF